MIIHNNRRVIVGSDQGFSPEAKKIISVVEKLVEGAAEGDQGLLKESLADSCRIMRLRDRAILGKDEYIKFAVSRREKPGYKNKTAYLKDVFVEVYEDRATAVGKLVLSGGFTKGLWIGLVSAEKGWLVDSAYY